MNEIGLDYVVRPGTMPRKSGWVMFLGSVVFVIDVGDRAHSDAQNTVCGGRDSAGA